MKLIAIRKARTDDSRDLFTWRNDEATRVASLNTSEILWGDHIKWYSSALQNPNIVLYISEDTMLGATSLGMCRFNISEKGDEAEVSINLNPEYRGRGLAQPTLHHALERFAKEFTNIELLTATIRTVNAASLKIFQAEKFIPVSEDGGVITLALRLTN